MKKTLTITSLVLLVLLAALLSFTACGGGEEHVHEFGEWETQKKATCTEDGSEYRTCDCGEEETRSIEATGPHSFGEWETTKAPTCQQAEIKTRVCSVCNASETKTLNKLPDHEYVEGVCKYCSTACTHTTKQGTCKTCGSFVNSLNNELTTIREAFNEVASLVQKSNLAITLGGNVNVDNCNKLVEQLNIVIGVLDANPNDFVDLRDHLVSLRAAWDTFVEYFNDTSSLSTRNAYWKTFSSFFLDWQKTYFTITPQYYPPTN